MTTGRRIRAFLWGDFDPCPLSRMDFLPRAVKIFFIRQPIATIAAYASMCIFTSDKTPELFQWLFAIITLVAASCCLVPYFTVLYKRLQGSNLPFPRVIVCLILTASFYFPVSDELSWEEAAISCGLSGALYFILFLLPNNKKIL